MPKKVIITKYARKFCDELANSYQECSENELHCRWNPAIKNCKTCKFHTGLTFYPCKKERDGGGSNSMYIENCKSWKPKPKEKKK